MTDERRLPTVTAGNMLMVLTNAVSNPAVDPEKMSRILDMHERILADQRRTAFMAALSRLQAKLPQIAREGTITSTGGRERSKYAKLEDIDTIIRPLLADEGFAFTFDEEEILEGGKVRFVGVLSHAEGHAESKRLTLPVDKAAIGFKGPTRN